MTNIHRITIQPPLINSACAWASDLEQLQDLYQSPCTGAVTIRSATLDGFAEDSSHTVAFAVDTQSSINSYGYSPYPLSQYFTWIESILHSHPVSSKPFIISIAASTPKTLSASLDAIQDFRRKLGDCVRDNRLAMIAVELNTSCPNIPGAAVPGHDLTVLAPLLEVLKSFYLQDMTLTLGLKLPPYTDVNAIAALVRAVGAVDVDGQNPVAFLTSANTLGTCLLFAEQCHVSGDPVGGKVERSDSRFAVPPGLGGLGGECVHALALGNVYALTRILRESDEESLRRIVVIGVGGVGTAEGVRRMQKVGAGVVGCATALGKHGVGIFETLAQGLEDEH